eukprot:Gb_20518 [translate_table: standard]
MVFLQGVGGVGGRRHIGRNRAFGASNSQARVGRQVVGPVGGLRCGAGCPQGGVAVGGLRLLGTWAPLVGAIGGVGGVQGRLGPVGYVVSAGGAGRGTGEAPGTRSNCSLGETTSPKWDPLVENHHKHRKLKPP